MHRVCIPWKVSKNGEKVSPLNFDFAFFEKILKSLNSIVLTYEFREKFSVKLFFSWFLLQFRFEAKISVNE